MIDRRQEPGRNEEALHSDAADWFARQSGPALVISPQSATLLAANPAGALTLGFETDFESSVPLDSAMPAIMDLRRVAARGPREGPAGNVYLVFWTPDGIARVPCRVVVFAAHKGETVIGVAIAESEVPSNRDTRMSHPSQTEGDRGAASSLPARSKTHHAAPHRPAAGTGADDHGGTRQPPLTSDHAKEDIEPAGDERVSPSASTNAARTGPTLRSGTPTSPAATEASATSQAPPIRTDADTLKAIARQILSGQRDSRPSPVATLPGERDVPALHAKPVPGRSNPIEKPAQSLPGAARSRSANANADLRDAGLRRAGRTSGASAANLPAAVSSASTDVRRSMPAQMPASTRTARDIGRNTSADQSPPRTGSQDFQPSDPKPQTAVAPPKAPAVAAPHDDPANNPSRTNTAADVSQAETSTAREAEDGGAGGEHGDGATPRVAGARRTMVRRIAHELKSPIGAIVSAAEIMKNETLGPIGDDRYLRYARDIYESARHALDVIERMLGSAVADQPAPPLSFVDIDINELVTSTASSMEHLARDAGLIFDIKLSPRMPKVIADATTVRQIVLNVLTNAIKFTPRGGTITLASRAPANQPLVLAISDTGPGMSSDEIAHVLRDQGDVPASSQIQRPGGGYGIGLPLALSLARANGAELTVSTVHPTGTEVALVFPISRLVLV